VSGLFVFIGSTPHSDIVAGVVALDDEGFILTGRDLERSQRLDPARWRGRTPSHMETSVPGIFAAGDVRSGSVRRVASAVGEGSVCISLVHQYLATR
jgi:thioredoxin reductase (NADPH)